MKKMSFWALAKKEFFSYINSPQAYVVIVPFVLLSHFLYFRTALLMGDANLRPFIELLPWFLVVIGPALAMRSFAEEYRKDTLELLFAHPLSEVMIVLAKFTGLFLFYGVFLLSTLALPITLIFFSKADIGLMISQYVSAFFIGGAFLAIGMAASAVVQNAVGSFLVGAAINFGLVILGMQFVVLMFPGILGRIVNELAVMTHMTNVSRGVLDLRDLLYFATVCAIALSVAIYKLSERKLAESPQEKRSLSVSLALLATVFLAANVLMSAYPLRLDLTQNRQFSLSSGTKKLLKELPDRLTLTLYTSRNLPAPMQVTLRETGDRMKDFSRYSGRVNLRTVYTDADPKAKEDATAKGIREVQFNQIGNSSFQVQTGFLGLEMRYADKTEVIPFIEDASDLEYQLSRLMIKLTQENRTKIGLLSSAGDSAVSLLSQLLSDQYEIIRLSDSSSDVELKELKSVLVVDDGSVKNASIAAMLKQYLNNNGNLLLFADGVTVDQQSLTASPASSEVLKTLTDYGLTVNADLVYDLQLNEAISLPMGNMRIIVNYPFWPRGLVNTKALPWPTQLSNVLLGWPSSINITPKEGVTVKQLVSTSRAGGHQEKDFTINPNNQAQFRALPGPSGSPHILAVSAIKGDQRVGLVANHHFVTDEFLKNSQENQTFASNFIDWVVADPILSSIPKRTSGRTVFEFTSPTQAQIVQYANLFLPPLLVGAFGFWWLKRRRELSRRVYAQP